MKRSHVLSATVGAGALLTLGAFAAVAPYPHSDTGSFVSSGTSTGATATQSAGPTTTSLLIAVPAIKGPAPLPTEEQGLPGG